MISLGHQMRGRNEPPLRYGWPDLSGLNYLGQAFKRKFYHD